MARTANALRPRWPRRSIRYIPASIIPQAILHPSAASSIVRIATRSAVATLTAPVMVRAIIRPNRISESRSTGSSTRPGSLMRCPPDLRPVVPLAIQAQHPSGLIQHAERAGETIDDPVVEAIMIGGPVGGQQDNSSLCDLPHGTPGAGRLLSA